MTATQRRIYLRTLIREYGQVTALLYFLDLDIRIRRDLEETRKALFVEKYSVKVEQTRELLQDELKRLNQEIDAVMDLMEQGDG